MRGFVAPRFVLRTESGAVQRCPRSGAIVVIITDPVSRGLVAALVNGGEAGHFADACAAVASHPKELAVAASWLAVCDRMSALRLGLAKCDLAPLIPTRAEEDSTRLANEYRRALPAHIPEWASFEILRGAKYLGVLHHARGHVGDAVHQCSASCESSTPAWQPRMNVRPLVERLLRVPVNAVPPAVIEDLTSVGLLALPQCAAPLFAARVRAAHRSLTAEDALARFRALVGEESVRAYLQHEDSSGRRLGIATNRRGGHGCRTGAVYEDWRAHSRVGRAERVYGGHRSEVAAV